MKNEISNLIHEIVTEKGGIYTTLFGCSSFDIHEMLKINWVLTKDDLKDNITIVLDNIISQVLQTYNTKYLPNKYKYKYYIEINSNYKTIIYNDIIYHNNFLPINYEIIEEIKFADIENYLNDIEIKENGIYIQLSWSFPIYKINKNSLVTF